MFHLYPFFIKKKHSFITWHDALRAKEPRQKKRFNPWQDPSYAQEILKRRTAGRLALFDGKTATEAAAIGRAVDK